MSHLPPINYTARCCFIAVSCLKVTCWTTKQSTNSSSYKITDRPTNFCSDGRRFLYLWCKLPVTFSTSLAAATGLYWTFPSASRSFSFQSVRKDRSIEVKESTKFTWSTWRDWIMFSSRSRINFLCAGFRSWWCDTSCHMTILKVPGVVSKSRLSARLFLIFLVKLRRSDYMDCLTVSPVTQTEFQGLLPRGYCRNLFPNRASVCSTVKCCCGFQSAGQMIVWFIAVVVSPVTLSRTLSLQYLDPETIDQWPRANIWSTRSHCIKILSCCTSSEKSDFRRKLLPWFDSAYKWCDWQQSNHPMTCSLRYANKGFSRWAEYEHGAQTHHQHRHSLSEKKQSLESPVSRLVASSSQLNKTCFHQRIKLQPSTDLHCSSHQLDVHRWSNAADMRILWYLGDHCGLQDKKVTWTRCLTATWWSDN